MACRDAAGRARRKCVDWQRSWSAQCREWRTGWTRRCDEWETTWTQRCDRWRTESERRCDRWEEERSRECEDWIVIFRWLCLAWTWVTTLVCRLWVWVTTTVCELWVWVSTTICRGWAWVASLVCAAWVLIGTWVCRAWVLVVELWCTIWCWFRRARAPNEFSEPRSECVYGWTSAYRADFASRGCALRITLRIRLVPDTGVSSADLATVVARWEPAIEGAWSGQFPLAMTDGTCHCERVSVAVDMRFVASGEHHTVTVHAGSGRADMTNWYVNSTGGTAAHEAGHMFGNADEYADSKCPSRTVTSDGSIMQTSQTGAVKMRHYESFQRWLSNRTCCTYTARAQEDR
jgi:hypothetical protein